MKIEFYNTEALVNKSDIESVEKKLCFFLPEEYKLHLL